MKTDEQIIEEFDEKFEGKFDSHSKNPNSFRREIRRFIFKALKEQRDGLMLDEEEIQKIIFYGSKACILNEHIFIGQEFADKLAKKIIQYQKQKV